MTGWDSGADGRVRKRTYPERPLYSLGHRQTVRPLLRWGRLGLVGKTEESDLGLSQVCLGLHTESTLSISTGGIQGSERRPAAIEKTQCSVLLCIGVGAISCYCLPWAGGTVET